MSSCEIKKEYSEGSKSHCATHSHQWALKGMSSDFSSNLHDVIKIVSFIKSRPLRTKIFPIFCKDI